jgi:hypothetical protein
MSLTSIELAAVVLAVAAARRGDLSPGARLANKRRLHDCSHTGASAAGLVRSLYSAGNCEWQLPPA